MCRLKKALYGLKQAPRAWFGKIARYLNFCGFKSSCADPSLFGKKTTIGCTMLLLYVDDMIITGDDIVEINDLQDALSIRFEMKRLGEADCFLGLEIKKGEDGYFLSKKGYASSLLERFHMENSREKNYRDVELQKIHTNEQAVCHGHACPGHVAHGRMPMTSQPLSCLFILGLTVSLSCLSRACCPWPHAHDKRF